MKYYPISKLQANTPEVGEILNLLQPLSTSSAEFDDMKISLILFMKSLRSDLGVEVEERYVDKVYRDSYYSYYDTKRLPYSRYCVRLSFFDSAFNKDVDLDNADNIRNNYLGFVVLRPLRYCIGRNVIDPKAKDDTSLQQAKICRATIESSCFGIKLNAVGFPHSSQDTETMTCAQTTIWALLEYYGNKYNIYRPTTPSEIKRILESFSYERQLPSSGLTYNQISVALRSLGFGSKVYTKGTNVERFHYQCVDRKMKQEYFDQWNVLSLYDQIAVKLFLLNLKLSYVYIDGCFQYISEVQSKNSGFTCGNGFFEEKFKESISDFNLPYNKAYLSRVKIGFHNIYLEHNELLEENETQTLVNYGNEISLKYKEIFDMDRAILQENLKF